MRRERPFASQPSNREARPDADIRPAHKSTTLARPRYQWARHQPVPCSSVTGHRDGEIRARSQRARHKGKRCRLDQHCAWARATAVRVVASPVCAEVASVNVPTHGWRCGRRSRRRSAARPRHRIAVPPSLTLKQHLLFRIEKTVFTAGTLSMIGGHLWRHACRSSSPLPQRFVYRCAA